MNEITINGQVIPQEALIEAQYANSSEELMQIAGNYGIPLSQDMADALIMEEMNDFDNLNGCGSSTGEPVTESSAESIPENCLDCKYTRCTKECGNNIYELYCDADHDYRYVYVDFYDCIFRFIYPDSCPLKK